MLELQQTGLMLSDRFLVKVMGKRGCGKFLSDREIYYNTYRCQQYGSKNFPMMEMVNVVMEAGCQCDQITVQTARFFLRDDVLRRRKQNMATKQNIVALQDRKGKKGV